MLLKLLDERLFLLLREVRGVGSEKPLKVRYAAFLPGFVICLDDFGGQSRLLSWRIFCHSDPLNSSTLL